MCGHSFMFVVGGKPSCRGLCEGTAKTLASPGSIGYPATQERGVGAQAIDNHGR